MQYDDLLDELKDAESLANNPLSKLFHEARTTGRHYSGVSCQIRETDNGIEVTEPVKTRRGEHLRGTGNYDGTISLPTRPFMSVRTARQCLRHQIRQLRQHKTRHN